MKQNIPYYKTQEIKFGKRAGEISEKLLQFIWLFGYFNKSEIKTTAGENIQIIYPGILNKDQGPDFKEAKIKIGDTIFAGSVEIHLQSSLWKQHGHEEDVNYKNVILHVVLKDDAPGINKIPVLELEPHISNLLLEKYEELMNNSSFIPCANAIAQVKPLTWLAWKERLLAERLLRKSEIIFQSLKNTNNHWEETFWQLLAKNFGIKVNSEAFAEMAATIPVTVLAKHKHQIHQLEALLFGQAGLLEKDFSEDYPKLLQKEYRFLQKKYSLKPNVFPIHFLRMRPQNFPTIRLAQLAVLIQSSSHIFSKVLEAKEVNEIKQWLNVTANDYWHYHFSFDEASSYKPKKLGTTMINNIIINTIAPILFAYGYAHKNEQQKTKALQFLEAIAAEENSILKGFKNLSVQNGSAYDSQALLELKNEYCNYKRCLECGVGNALLKAN